MYTHGVVEYRTRVNRKFLKAKGQKVAVRIVQQGTVTLSKKRKINRTLNVRNGLMHGRGWGTMDLGIAVVPDPRTIVANRLVASGISRTYEGALRFVSGKVTQARAGGTFAAAWCRVFALAWR